MSDEESPFIESPAAQQVSPTGQVIIYQEKSSIPAVVGVLFSLSQVLTILAGVALLGLGAIFVGFAGEVGDDEVATEAGLVAVFGALIVILGLVGIIAGVLIAQRKKFGIHLAWGLLGGTVLLTFLNSVINDFSFDWTTPLCNGICAVWVGLPLMIESARVHME